MSLTAAEQRTLNKFVRIAKENKLTKQQRRQYHLSVITERGIPISMCWNQVKTHPISKKHYPLSNTIHAELGAILAAKGLKGNYSKAKLWVIRIDNNGNPANSKPCACCQAIIDTLNFKSVIHS